VDTTISQSIDQEAVSHAKLAEHAADLAWTHLRAEYTQDINTVLSTLAPDAPLTWTLPQLIADDGTITYLAGTNIDEVRGQYEALREFVEIHDWRAMLEIRQGWYTLTHGVIKLLLKETGEFSLGETVTMFPTGVGGILGEVQVGGIGTPEMRPQPDIFDVGAVELAPSRTEPNAPPADPPTHLPAKRLEVLRAQDEYIEALRGSDVDAIVGAHRANGAMALRSYLTEASSVVAADGEVAMTAYFTELFRRYRVRDIQMVNRVAESWYTFAELHWCVDEVDGSRRTLEFCTAETASLDEDGRYWARTGIGTDPVVV
jgi:hypothetical protein